jgi:hypothetical protein
VARQTFNSPAVRLRFDSIDQRMALKARATQEVLPWVAR